jgi:hypothetical protein
MFALVRTTKVNGRVRNHRVVDTFAHVEAAVYRMTRLVRDSEVPSTPEERVEYPERTWINNRLQECQTFLMLAPVPSNLATEFGHAD